MTANGRTQNDRLIENIDLMEGLATGKGKGFILPKTAREIGDDLRNLQGRIRDEGSKEADVCFSERQRAELREIVETAVAAAMAILTTPMLVESGRMITEFPDDFWEPGIPGLVYYRPATEADDHEALTDADPAHKDTRLF
jgi:hypothetical protein